MGEHRLIAPQAPPAYIGESSFADYLEYVQGRHPFLARMIAARPGPKLTAYVAEMNALSWEFEADAGGGRGNAYNTAQMVAGNRSAGMATLLSMFGEEGAMPGRGRIVLDALAGDGTVSRFAATLAGAPTLISADISALMVQSCMEQGLPCVRQSAAQSLLRDDVLDGVLIAYGSHHLDAAARRAAAAEAMRTLKPGGRLVLHDFEVGGPVDAFFREVVHPYTATGHPHPHFTRGEMRDLLEGAGFRDIRVIEMDDPFLIPGLTAEGARAGMLAHLWHMYGLIKLGCETAAERDDLEARVAATLGRIDVYETGHLWEAKLGRTALVAIGTA